MNFILLALKYAIKSADFKSLGKREIQMLLKSNEHINISCRMLSFYILY